MPRTHPLKDTRNIGIMAHIDAGKTTTTERILYYTGRQLQARRGPRGHGDDGLDGPGAGARHHDHVRRDDLLLEGDPDRRARPDQHHRHAGPRGLHGRGRAVAARARRRGRRLRRGRGVEPQSETVWRQANRYDVPRIAFVNKMDRVGANFPRCVEMMKTKLNAKPAPIQIPWGTEAEHRGVIDLVAMKAIDFKDDDARARSSTSSRSPRSSGRRPRPTARS